MSENERPIGAALRALRKERGLSLREVASRTGISFSRIAELERGSDSHSSRSTVPRYEVIQQLCRLYGVSSTDFVRLAGYMPEPEMPADERRLLALYRQLDAVERRRILLSLEREANDDGATGAENPH